MYPAKAECRPRANSACFLSSCESCATVVRTSKHFGALKLMSDLPFSHMFCCTPFCLMFPNQTHAAFAGAKAEVWLRANSLRTCFSYVHHLTGVTVLQSPRLVFGVTESDLIPIWHNSCHTVPYEQSIFDSYHLALRMTLAHVLWNCMAGRDCQHHSVPD